MRGSPAQTEIASDINPTSPAVKENWDIRMVKNQRAIVICALVQDSWFTPSGVTIRECTSLTFWAA